MKIKHLAAALLVILLAGCGAQKDTMQQHEFFAMDTVMLMTAYGPHAGEGLAAAEAEVRRVEALFSTTAGAYTSEITRINVADGSPQQVSQEVADLLTNALELGDRTDGMLDITIYPAIQRWGFISGEYSVPPAEELVVFADLIDYRQVVVEGTQVTVPKGMQIDLGSIAKGYAADRAAQAMQEAGVPYGLVSLGGDVRTFGEKPDGSPFRIAVQNPGGEGYLGVVEMGEGSVVTSGDYERFFEGPDGTRYHHILNPADGYPARSGLTAVTIVSDESREGDALSTALFVMGLQKGAEFWRAHRDFEAIFVTNEGDTYVTEGLRQSYTHEGAGAFYILETE